MIILPWLIPFFRKEDIPMESLSWFGLVAYFVAQTLLAGGSLYIAKAIVPSHEQIVAWAITGIWVVLFALVAWVVLMMPDQKTWRDMLVVTAMVVGSLLIAIFDQA
jgi:cell division protein FtsW (lipid II flippase)